MPAVALVSAAAVARDEQFAPRILGSTENTAWLPIERAELDALDYAAVAFLDVDDYSRAIRGLSDGEIAEVMRAETAWASRALAIVYAGERSVLYALLETEGDQTVAAKLQRLADIRGWRALADLRLDDAVLYTIEDLYRLLYRFDHLEEVAAREGTGEAVAQLIETARVRLSEVAVRLQRSHAELTGQPFVLLPHAPRVYRSMFIEPADRWLRDWLRANELISVGDDSGVVVVAGAAAFRDLDPDVYRLTPFLADAEPRGEIVVERTAAQQRELIRRTLSSRQPAAARQLALNLGEMIADVAGRIVLAERSGALATVDGGDLQLLRRAVTVLHALGVAPDGESLSVGDREVRLRADLEWLALLCRREQAAAVADFLDRMLDR